MREMGIALATAVSAWINALLLNVMLSLRNNIKFDSLLISNSIDKQITNIVFMGMGEPFLNYKTKTLSNKTTFREKKLKQTQQLLLKKFIKIEKV